MVDIREPELTIVKDKKIVFSEKLNRIALVCEKCKTEIAFVYMDGKQFYNAIDSQTLCKKCKVSL